MKYGYSQSSLSGWTVDLQLVVRNLQQPCSSESLMEEVLMWSGSEGNTDHLTGCLNSPSTNQNHSLTFRCAPAGTARSPAPARALKDICSHNNPFHFLCRFTLSHGSGERLSGLGVGYYPTLPVLIITVSGIPAERLYECVVVPVCRRCWWMYSRGNL